MDRRGTLSTGAIGYLNTNFERLKWLLDKEIKPKKNYLNTRRRGKGIPIMEQGINND